MPGSPEEMEESPAGGQPKRSPMGRPQQRSAQPGVTPTPARRKKRSKAREERQHQGVQSQSVIMSVLNDLRDDIMEGPPPCEPAGVLPLGAAPPTPLRLRGDKVYVQRERGGFYCTTRDKVPGHAPAPDPGEDPGTSATPLGTAIAVQGCLLPFYTLCHGLLGGMAVALLILSYSSASPAGENTRFMETLSPFISVTGTVFYFLSAICTVSVFDRFDLSNMDFGHLPDVVRYQGAGLVIVAVYVFTLASTLACTRWDEGIALYHHHNSSHWDGEQELLAELATWRSLNACRCAGGMLGWLLVAVAGRSSRDLLHEHLAAMLPYQAGPGASPPP